MHRHGSQSSISRGWSRVISAAGIRASAYRQKVAERGYRRSAVDTNKKEEKKVKTVLYEQKMID